MHVSGRVRSTRGQQLELFCKLKSGHHRHVLGLMEWSWKFLFILGESQNNVDVFEFVDLFKV